MTNDEPGAPSTSDVTSAEFSDAPPPPEPKTDPKAFLIENHDRLMGRKGFAEQRRAHDELEALNVTPEQAAARQADFNLTWPGVSPDAAVEMSTVAVEAARSVGATPEVTRDLVAVVERGLSAHPPSL